jgi:hypothetical protein
MRRRAVQVLQDQLSRRAGPGGEALIPSLQRALADLQERLIYRLAANLFGGMMPHDCVVSMCWLHLVMFLYLGDSRGSFLFHSMNCFIWCS